VYDLKDFVGSKFSDAALQARIKQWPFAVVDAGDDVPAVEVTYLGKKEQYNVTQLLTMLFKKMKQLAENIVGKTVTDTGTYITSCCVLLFHAACIFKARK
jgi:L1 cell adhesion molecule like protein